VKCERMHDVLGLLCLCHHVWSFLLDRWNALHQGSSQFFSRTTKKCLSNPNIPRKEKKFKIQVIDLTNLIIWIKNTTTTNKPLRIIDNDKLKKWSFANTTEKYPLNTLKRFSWSYLIMKQKINKNVISPWKAI
jgi:hypothetical protein